MIPFIGSTSPAETRRWMAALRAAMPGEVIAPLEALDAAARAACDVAIVANPQPHDLRALPRLQWVHSVWAGVDRLIAELQDLDVKVVRLQDPQLARTMAEAVLAWTLYLHRDMPRYARQQAARQWVEHDYIRPERKTVSLLGLGALGAASAQRLREAGFQVCGWSRTPSHLPGVAGYIGDEGLMAMLRRTDILVCLLPLTPQTRGVINARALEALPPQASLINFARGAIVDELALRQALDSGHLAHAVLDVFTQEPLPPDAWPWSHLAVTVLPHISGPTDYETASAIVAKNISAYRADGSLPPVVDRQRGY